MKTISGGSFSTLKAYIDVYSKDAVQWRFIESNWKRDSFDPEQDVREFGHKNLSATRYRSRRWLIKTLSKITYYPHKKILEKLCEIRTAIYRDDVSMASTCIQEAKAIARKRECFHEWLLLLKLEGEMIRKAHPKENWATIAVRIKTERKAVQQLQANLEEFEDVRNLLELPVVKAYDLKASCSDELMQGLEDAPPLQDVQGCLSTRARHEFHAIWAGIFLRKGEIKQAHLCFLELMRLYSGNSWLRDENLDRFWGHLQGMIGLECLLDNKEKALEHISRFSKLDMGDPSVALVAVPWMIYSKFYIADHFGEMEMALEAIRLWEDRAPLLRLSLKPNRQIDFDFRSAKYCIVQGAFKEAMGYLDRIYDFDTKTRLLYKPHIRALETICALALEKEPTDVEHKSIMAARFIKRQPVPNAVPLLTVQFVKCIAHTWKNPKEIEEATTEFVKNLEELISLPENEDALSFFDYKMWALSLLEMGQSPSKIPSTVMPPPASTL